MADDGRPVLTGLVALAGVGLVVGLLVSGATLAATQVLGLGDSGGTAAGPAAARQSMYLPTPVPTVEETGPLLTLAPDPDGSAASSAATAAPAPPPEPAVPTISLAASTASAAPGDTITLSGTYAGGAEGATLIVERLTDGTWAQFVDVSTSVSGQMFSTQVHTSVTGESTFRMRDAATGTLSNEVKFTIG